MLLFKLALANESAKNINKAQKGHFKDLGNFRHVKEFKSDATHAVGDKIDLSLLKKGILLLFQQFQKAKAFKVL
jgi:large subunit ribosomal protein L3